MYREEGGASFHLMYGDGIDVILVSLMYQLIYVQDVTPPWSVNKERMIRYIFFFRQITHEGPYEYIRMDAARVQRAERRARLDCNSNNDKNLYITHAEICT